MYTNGILLMNDPIVKYYDPSPDFVDAIEHEKLKRRLNIALEIAEELESLPEERLLQKVDELIRILKENT